MNHRILYVALATLISTPVLAADAYRDALSAFNSGHYDVARQLANQLRADDPQRAEMLQSIDTAVASARTPKEYELSVDELEQQNAGTVYRSLDDPQLMEQLYQTLDSSSEQSAGELITADQQVALLKKKMNLQPLKLTGNTPQQGEDRGKMGPVVLNGASQDSLTLVQLSSSPPGSECLSPDKIKNLFSKARTAAAAFAMDKARAIAKANEIRQQRAVARMRLEITAEVTRKVRRDLDSRFNSEVAERVAALEAGKVKQQPQQWVSDSPGQGEYLLAQRYAAGNVMGSGESRAWLELAAGKGNAQAQFELGQWFFQPATGEPNYAAAHSWWTRAKLAGHVDAVAALAMLRQREVITTLAVNDTQ